MSLPIPVFQRPLLHLPHQIVFRGLPPKGVTSIFSKHQPTLIGRSKTKTIKINTEKLSPTEITRETTKGNHEIISHLLNELDAIEITASGHKSPLQNNPVTEANDKSKDYIRILSRSNAFKNDEEKYEYLLKELENALIKIEILKLDINSLKNDNENLIDLTKKMNEPKDEEYEEITSEIEQVKSIIATQNSELEALKKEVIEKYCKKC